MKLPIELQQCSYPISIEAVVRLCASLCFEIAEAIKKDCQSNYTSDDFTAQACGESILEAFGLK